MSNKKLAMNINGEKTDGDKAMIDVPWQNCPRPVWDKSTLIFRDKFPCTIGRISLQTQLAPSNSFDRAATRHTQTVTLISYKAKYCSK